MQRQRDELYPFFEKHAIPTASNFVDLIDSMLNQETDGVFKPSGDPLSVKGIGTEEGLLNFYRVDEQGDNQLTWQFKQKPDSAAGLSINDANAPSRLFIESGTGNVGIGTTTPKSALAVSGGVAVGTNYAKTNAANDNNLIVEGNVGIGTTTPGAKLSFVNRNATEEAVGLTWHDGGPTTYGIHRTAGPWSQPDFQQLRLGWLTGIILDGGTRFGKSYVDIQGNGLRVTAGNVGIGTTEPTAKLEIKQAERTGIHPTTVKGLYVTGDFGMASDGVEFRHSNASQGIGFGHNSIYATGSNENQDLNLIPRGTGGVGIGTTSPGEMLHLASTGSAKIKIEADTDNIDESHHPQLLFSQDGGNMTAYLGFSDGTNHLRLATTWDDADSDIDFMTRNTVRMTIEGDGNVGIGIQAPTAKLDVGGASGEISLQLRGGNFGTQITLGHNNSANYRHVIKTRHHSSNQLGNAIDFYVWKWLSNSDKDNAGDIGSLHTMTLAGGKVGIGTTAPIQQLDVNGRMNVNKGVIQRGGTAITNTSDLGLYSRTRGSWIRLVTNSAPIKFYSDDGVGSTPNFTIEKDSPVVARFGFSGLAKFFKIPHPTRSGFDLVHASVEGPEVAVYYRGEAQLVNGQTVITLPEYFNALTRPGSYTVQLTPKGSEPYLLSYSDFQTGAFHVHGTKPNGAFAWEVKAIRADIDPLEVETPVEEPEEALV